MAVPLSVLCFLAMIGGYFMIPVAEVFPASDGSHPAHWVEYVSISVPLVGLLIAYLVPLRSSLSCTTPARRWDRQLRAICLTESSCGYPFILGDRRLLAVVPPSWGRLLCATCPHRLPTVPCLATSKIVLHFA